MKTAPVAKPVVEYELRRWADGKHQENTGSYVRTFINPDNINGCARYVRHWHLTLRRHRG